MSNKLKLFNIAMVGGSIKQTSIQYYAESEEECKELFMDNNTDLDETDFWVKEKKEC